MPHLVVYISGHGFGHIAQTGPVLDALRQLQPALRLTVVSGAPEFKLRQRIGGDFVLVPRAADFGFVMSDAFRIDRAASAAAYRDFHAGWEERVAAEADFLQGLDADLLLSNVAYLPLASAAQLGLPAYAMSSLNWADLFAHEFAGETWAPSLHAQMLAAYRSARTFFRLAPAMAMPDLPQGRPVDPVARLGTRQDGLLRQVLGVGQGTRLVLAALGGIATRLPAQTWPAEPGLHWLVPAAWGVDRPDMSAFEPLGWDFADLLASVDAVVGKPGYGTFAEAACNGTPMLYARRPDWPEQEALIPWLQAHAVCREVEESALQAGDLGADLAALWQQPVPPRPQPRGALQVAACLHQALGG
ncbi:hypothetical protein [Azospira sp. I09]|uniref:hypothetical protein n=1 Tax=Azospira sp. I09 TaxID=1765049 RepID=UPI0012612316|nr:hypothetical protein [Azospira sp. I09]BBN88993.1 hypothetical protein AZSP09_20160 [Azospira sp. I09]